MLLPLSFRTELTAHAQNKFVCESGGLPSDMIWIIHVLNTESFLVTIEIESSLSR